MVLAMMLGMLILAWSLPDAPAPHAAEEAPSLWRVLRRPEAIALIVAGALMSAAHGPYYTFFSIHAVDHGYSKAATGWLWALGVVAEMAIFIWMPLLYRAFTLRRILIASFALAVVRFLIIGWAVDSVAMLLLAQLLHAATFGSFHAASIGVIHRLFRGRLQARGQALYGSLAYGVGGAVGGFSSGYAWDCLGAAATFSLSAACALIGMLVLWRGLKGAS
jgi:PPP family 3-phenylpropionic acid transporter